MPPAQSLARCCASGAACAAATRALLCHVTPGPGPGARSAAGTLLLLPAGPLGASPGMLSASAAKLALLPPWPELLAESWEGGCSCCEAVGPI